ncbi:MAG: NifB/NifX family molybdenum-iron cluster-binding protein [archaeon]|nr:NifB/NifX family molybdenum-iron cluster-binding protein [archaeon]
MKVGVIAEGDSLDALVGEDFGHAPYFLIVDLDTYDYTVVENEYAKGDGAGYKVANAIVGLGVDAVIVGGIGTHGLKILQDAKIRVLYDADGTVEENLDDLKNRIELEKKFEGKQ